MVPIPMLVVNEDICRNVWEYSSKQKCVNDVWRGDIVLVLQYINTLTVIPVMVIMRDGYSLCASKFFFFFFFSLIIAIFYLLLFIFILNFISLKFKYKYIYIYIYIYFFFKKIKNYLTHI